MAGDDFDIALEKLWIHGGAIVDYAENISPGDRRFRRVLFSAAEHKVEQFEKVLAYCESACCRMLALVRYFGDTADSRRACGVCDFCDPRSAIAQTFRPATEAERAHIRMIAEALKGADGSQPAVCINRRSHMARWIGVDLKTCSNAMARAGLVTVTDSSFEKDGRRIEFRKVRLTPEGQEAEAAEHVTIPEEVAAVPGQRKSRKTAKSRAPQRE